VLSAASTSVSLYDCHVGIINSGKLKEYKCVVTSNGRIMQNTGSGLKELQFNLNKNVTYSSCEMPR
jgi:hypothetical protein